MIETYRGAVYPWHCDQMGHMNVMWYVGKFDEATRHLFNAIGITPAFVRENKRGMAAVEQTIQYKRELLAGDVVTVHSVLVDGGHAALRAAQVRQRQPDGVEQLPARLVELADVPHDVHVADVVAVPRVDGAAVGEEGFGHGGSCGGADGVEYGSRKP